MPAKKATSAKRKNAEARQPRALLEVIAEKPLAEGEFNVSTAKKLPATKRPQPLRLHLNLADMKANQLNAGDFVILGSALCIAWPSMAVQERNLQAAEILIVNAKLTGDIGTLSIPISVPVVANTVSLRCQIPVDYDVDDTLSMYLKEVLSTIVCLH